MATYEGRLVADGMGNLLADDDGPDKGKAVAYDPDTDTYVFVKAGEPSHNERHHLQFAGTVPTQDADPDADGYAGQSDDPTEGNEHHFDAPPAPDEPSELKFHPDMLAREVSGHTNQHRLGGEE